MGFCEACEVIKVAVMSEQEITVTIALTLGCGGDDRDAVGRLRGHLSSQLRTAFGVQVGIKAHVERAV